MSCYTRHLDEFLPARPSAGDKRELDRAVRRVLGLQDAACPQVWAAVKDRRDAPSFADEVRAAMEGTS